MNDFDWLFSQVYGNATPASLADRGLLDRAMQLATALPANENGEQTADKVQTRAFPLFLALQHRGSDQAAASSTASSGLAVLAALGSTEARRLSGSNSGSLSGDRGNRKAAPSARMLSSGSLYNKSQSLLRTLLAPASLHAPPFMQTTNWGRAKLVTALGWWAEGQQDAQMLAGTLDRAPGAATLAVLRQGYVEPVPSSWDALADLADRLATLTTEQHLLAGISTSDASLVEQAEAEYRSTLRHLARAARAELAGRSVRAEDQPYLDDPDRYLGAAQVTVVRHTPSALTVTGSQSAAIATIPRGQQSATLQVGSGLPQELWVVLPIGGKQYLARGVIYSYYELLRPQPLSNTSWQTGAWAGQRQPSWTGPFSR